MPHVHYTFPSIGLQMYDSCFRFPPQENRRSFLKDCHAELKLFDFQRLQLCFPRDPCMVTYIYHKNQRNVGEYTIHGWYGFVFFFFFLVLF